MIYMVDTETPKQREIGDKQMMCLRVYYATTAGDTAPACRGPPEEVSIFDFVPELVVANTGQYGASMRDRHLVLKCF